MERPECSHLVLGRGPKPPKRCALERVTLVTRFVVPFRPARAGATETNDDGFDLWEQLAIVPAL